MFLLREASSSINLLYPQKGCANIAFGSFPYIRTLRSPYENVVHTDISLFVLPHVLSSITSFNNK